MLSYLEFSKKYKVPRTSVYDIMNKLEEEDFSKYDKCVEIVGNSKKLNEEGIQYILELRGLDVEDSNKRHTSDRQTINKFQEQSNELVIDILRKELEQKNKQLEQKDTQLNSLQENYNNVVMQLKETNDHLIEISKNQQFLTNQLQQSNMIDKLEHQKDNVRTEPTDTVQVKKKGFFSKLFN